MPPAVKTTRSRLAAADNASGPAILAQGSVAGSSSTPSKKEKNKKKRKAQDELPDAPAEPVLPATPIQEGERKKRKRKRGSNAGIIATSLVIAPPSPGQGVPAGDIEVEAKVNHYMNDESVPSPSLAKPGLTNPALTNSPDIASPFFRKTKKSKHRKTPSSQPSTTTTLAGNIDEKPDLAERTARRDEAKLLILQQQLDRLTEERKKEQERLDSRIKELEEEVEKKTQDSEASAQVIETQNSVRTQLQEAINCQVCLETLKDPHILSCGHVACKGCLQKWFRTTPAYVHAIPDPGMHPNHNLSYRTKICHVCRTYIVNRPARVYHLERILGPLGLDPHIPSASQVQAERANKTDDPWHNLFPPERDQYKLKDETDQVERCPGCFEEIDRGICTGCANEFSEAEDNDWGQEDVGSGSEDSIGSDHPLDHIVLDVDSDELSDGSEDMSGVLVIGNHNDRAQTISDGSSIPSSDDDSGPEDASDHDRTRGRRGQRRQAVAGHGNPSPRQAQRPNAIPNVLAGVLDIMAEEDELGERGDYPGGTDDEEDEEDSYEDSFIDDGDSNEAEGSEASDAESVASGALDLGELRLRRTARYARQASPAPPAQASTRRRGRVIASESDSD